MDGKEGERLAYIDRLSYPKQVTFATNWRDSIIHLLPTVSKAIECKCVPLFLLGNSWIKNATFAQSATSLEPMSDLNEQIVISLVFTSLITTATTFKMPSSPKTKRTLLVLTVGLILISS